MRIARQIGFALSALTLLAIPADAAKKPKRAAKQVSKVCAGKDMLAELNKTNRTAFTKIFAETAATENERALLWRIEREGTEPSYLFGTVHLADKRITQFPSVVQETLASSKRLLVETDDPSPEATASALTRASQAALYQDGSTLKSKLTPDEFSQARSALEKLGLPTATIPLYRPWLVSMLTASSPCELARTKKGEPFLDAKLIKAARARKIPVIGLETLDDQLSALASVPDDDQLNILRANLAYADRKDDIMETVVNLYRSRRISAAWHFQLALTKKAGIDPAAYDTFKELIVVGRNRTMHQSALPYVEQGGAFVAVGAMHLPGKQGLVARFKDSGYTLVPLN